MSITHIPYITCSCLRMVTHLPRTNHGHNMLMVVVDRLSKMCHLVPICGSATSKQIAQAYYTHVLRGSSSSPPFNLGHAHFDPGCFQFAPNSPAIHYRYTLLLQQQQYHSYHSHRTANEHSVATILFPITHFDCHSYCNSQWARMPTLHSTALRFSSVASAQQQPACAPFTTSCINAAQLGPLMAQGALSPFYSFSYYLQ